MKSPLIYVGHPIDGMEMSPQTSYRVEQVEQILCTLGAVIYRPAGAFMLNPDRAEPNEALQGINNYALKKCDGMIGMYPELSIGVPMELQLADALSKPAIAIRQGDVGKSWSLASLTCEVLSDEADLDHELERFMADVAAVGHVKQMAATSTANLDNRIELPTQVSQDGTLPTQGYSDDAGFDLYSASETWIDPGATVDIPCSIRMQLPDGVWGLILGRSSTLRTHNLLVNPGVIDTGYRGELFVNIKNMNGHRFVVEQGMRLGQMIPLPNLAASMRPVRVDKLEESERGTAGFGSSGR